MVYNSRLEVPPLTAEAYQYDLYAPEEFQEHYPNFVSKQDTERSRLRGGTRINNQKIDDLTVIETSFSWRPAKLAQLSEAVEDSAARFENEPVTNQEITDYLEHGRTLISRAVRKRLEIVNQKIGRIGTLFYAVHPPDFEHDRSKYEAQTRIGRLTRLITYRGKDFDPICGLLGRSGIEYEYQPKVSDFWLIDPTKKR